MIITIGREFGSYGHVIGRELAKKLGIKYYDKETLAQEAKKSGQYEELRDFYEEQPVTFYGKSGPDLGISKSGGYDKAFRSL